MQGGKWTTVNMLVSGLIWVIGAVVGIYTVYSIYKLAGTVYALFGSDYYTGVVISQVVAVVFGLILIVAIISIGEYLFKRSGEKIPWRIFAWMGGVEFLIILLGVVFG